MANQQILQEISSKLNIHFKDSNLLFQALVHRSYINEHPELETNNERLEFLGDAVLELVITEYLYTNYPLPEGELTLLRSALVKKDNLAKVAGDYTIGQYLFLSKGEEKSGGREKSYLLANALEAIIGAVYLDQGLEIARAFVITIIIPTLQEIVEQKRHIDAKSLFQEKSQAILSITPQYKLQSESGPAHDRLFVMAVYHGDDMIATGQGQSKQQAEQAAARNALAAKQW
ncbi:MAG: ribonuclease III [Candidatus Abawacabacteria bacterium]|nr:ribonuclease III [Candidatus Abawacabacteria bacterium]